MFLIVSFFVSGCVLHRLRPTPRTIAVYNAAVAVVVAFGFAMAMLIKCHYASMPGVTVFKGRYASLAFFLICLPCLVASQVSLVRLLVF